MSIELVESGGNKYSVILYFKEWGNKSIDQETLKLFMISFIDRWFEGASYSLRVHNTSIDVTDIADRDKAECLKLYINNRIEPLKTWSLKKRGLPQKIKAAIMKLTGE